MEKTKSDGGSTNYYDFPSWCRDVGDLIHYRQMSFNIGNIFKACYRLGKKAGVDRRYDLNKIIWFAQRELEYLDRDEGSEPKGTSCSEAQEPHSEGPWFTEVPSTD